ncbi:MAG: CDP-alcohol phosphatidyltransferase family protein [Gemmatimonadota bacterium]
MTASALGATPLRHIPLALTALRALLGPVVILLAYVHPDPVDFAACLIAAFLSDVFDGVIARRLGVATPGIRRLDSIADSVFYVCALFAAWHMHPTIIADHIVALCLLGALEVARYGFDLRKFGREASYHMWSSKLWGIALLAAFISMLVFGSSGLAVSAAIYIGILADTEGLVISMLLRKWTSDVPSFVHAYRLRLMHAGA